MTEQHECGCSTLGPGPHDVDARHPNPRACEHAEMPRVTVERLEAALDALDPKGAHWDHRTGDGVLLTNHGLARALLDSIVDPSL